MTALAANGTPYTEFRFKYRKYTLTSGQVAYQGSSICLRPSTGKCVVAAATASDDLIFLGFAVEKVDASSADKLVNVEHPEEIVAFWFPNATSTDAVASTDFGKTVYLADDQTATITATAHAVLGKCWGVDSTKGVLVQKVAPSLRPVITLPAFAAGDTAPTSIVDGAVYDVPATAANSTISLPAAAPDGTVAFFHADGTKNGHTLTFRDVTTAISAATTASKRVAATAIKADGKWVVHLTVGP